MRLLLLLFLAANLPAYGQFDFRDAQKKVASGKVYNADFDFDRLDCNVLLSSLVGEVIYFARRDAFSTGIGGTRDSIPPFDNLTAALETPLAKIMPTDLRTQLENFLIGGSWTIRDVSMRDRVASDRYSANKHYTTFIYKPEVTTWPVAHVVEINTPYAAVENKFFKIKECHDSSNMGNGFCWICFTLEDPDGNILYWPAHSGRVGSYHAHFKNYLIKEKNEYKDKKFYVRRDVNIPQYCGNIIDASEYELAPEKEFTCTDMTFIKPVSGGVGIPCLVFKDTSGRELGVSPDTYAKGCSISFFWTEDEHHTYLEKKQKDHDLQVATAALNEERMKKERQDEVKRLETTYGKANARLIMRGEVVLGHSKAVCRESWGEPSSITKSEHRGVITEIWRYQGSRWLRFTDGVLTAFTE